MNTVRAYALGLLVAAGMGVSLPNYAINFNLSCLSNYVRASSNKMLLAVPSLQEVRDFTGQIKDRVLENRYFPASVLVAGVLAGSYFCYKCFGGNKSIVEPTVALVEPAVEQAYAQPGTNQADMNKEQDANLRDSELAVKQQTEAVLPRKAEHGLTQETAHILNQAQYHLVDTPKEDQAFPIKPSVIGNREKEQVIKVANDSDQSLSISVSNGDDVSKQHFVVPGYSYKQINL